MNGVIIISNGVIIISNGAPLEIIETLVALY